MLKSIDTITYTGGEDRQLKLEMVFMALLRIRGCVLRDVDVYIPEMVKVDGKRHYLSRASLENFLIDNWGEGIFETRCVVEDALKDVFYELDASNQIDIERYLAA